MINSGHRIEEDNALECLWRSVLNNVVITWINECCNPFSGCYFTIVSKLFNLIWTSWKTESVVREIFKRAVVSLCERWKGTCRLTSNIFVSLPVFLDEGWLISFFCKPMRYWVRNQLFFPWISICILEFASKSLDLPTKHKVVSQGH